MGRAGCGSTFVRALSVLKLGAERSHMYSTILNIQLKINRLRPRQQRESANRPAECPLFHTIWNLASPAAGHAFARRGDSRRASHPVPGNTP